MRHTARVDPDAHRIAVLGDGIVQIRLPMRHNPLRYVNAYAIEEDDGLTLVDCGWKADDVLAALHEGLAAFGASLADVRRLFITHFHHDHYGLAGTLRRAGVPALAMHRHDWEVAQWILGDPIAADRTSDAWLARNGFDPSPLEGEGEHYHRSEPSEPTEFLEDGARYGRLRAIWTPGHSPGHICFVDERSGRFLSGDHVLDPITPHVGQWIEASADPLGDDVASLRKVAALTVAGVLPAHGEPFADLAGRVAQLLAHQAERERHVLDALASGPRDAAAIAAELPWTREDRSFESLGEMHRQFAVAETLAYLQHAWVRKLVQRTDAGSRITYALPEGA